MTVSSGEDADIKRRQLPAAREASRPARVVHNVELEPGRGGQIARSAGAVDPADGQGRRHGDAAPALRARCASCAPSCRATVGEIGNPDHGNVTVGKAGRKRHLGMRPQTRGVAMNPVDHPHGGGEGQSKGGRHPVTPWGVPTLG